MHTAPVRIGTPRTAAATAPAPAGGYLPVHAGELRQPQRHRPSSVVKSSRTTGSRQSTGPGSFTRSPAAWPHGRRAGLRPPHFNPSTHPTTVRWSALAPRRGLAARQGAAAAGNSSAAARSATPQPPRTRRPPVIPLPLDEGPHLRPGCPPGHGRNRGGLLSGQGRVTCPAACSRSRLVARATRVVAELAPQRQRFWPRQAHPVRCRQQRLGCWCGHRGPGSGRRARGPGFRSRSRPGGGPRRGPACPARSAPGRPRPGPRPAAACSAPRPGPPRPARAAPVGRTARSASIRAGAGHSLEQSIATPDALASAITRGDALGELVLDAAARPVLVPAGRRLRRGPAAASTRPAPR